MRDILSGKTIDKLLELESSDNDRLRALEIKSTDIQERLENLNKIYPAWEKITPKYLHQPQLMWSLWLPIAKYLVRQKEKINQPLIQGILGVQGTGKTTLVSALKFILETWGYQVLSISLDDFYKTYYDRQELRKNDPRLIWRGPPKTHDLDLALDVLSKIKSGERENISVPIFDKSLYDGMGDRVGYQEVMGADIVLFEGWFVGMETIDDQLLLTEKIPPINNSDDLQFAKDCNQWLKEYLPLWSKIDRLLILYPLDYRWSKEWRWSAEEKMIQSGKEGMNRQKIDEFVDYFWRSLHPQIFLPNTIKKSKIPKIIVEIKRDRSIARVY